MGGLLVYSQNIILFKTQIYGDAQSSIENIFANLGTDVPTHSLPLKLNYSNQSIQYYKSLRHKLQNLRNSRGNFKQTHFPFENSSSQVVQVLRRGVARVIDRLKFAGRSDFDTLFQLVVGNRTGVANDLAGFI